MKREELEGLSYQEYELKLEEALNAHSEEVSKLMTEEEVLDAEKAIIEELKANDEYFETIKYTLPNGVDFDGKHYSKNDVANKIIYFLNKVECKWEVTLGMYQLVQMWKNKDLTEIEYKSYDSTLRCLNQVQFKGYQEWQDILTINEYMSQCHEQYSRDTAWLWYLSSKHNNVINRMELVKPIDNTIDESMVGVE